MKKLFLFSLLCLGILSCGDQQALEADKHFQAGEQKIVAQDFAGAEADFSKAIELDPDRYTPYHGRGEVRLMLGKKAEGVADLGKAMELMQKSQDMDDPRMQSAYAAIKAKYEANRGK